MPSKLSGLKRYFWLPLHPFLFAAFPIIFLYSYNIEETNILMTFRPLLFVLAATMISFLLAKLIFRSWIKAGILVTLGVLIFFSHGHIHNLIGDLKYAVLGFEFGTDDTLFAVWAVLGAGTFVSLLRTKRDLLGATRFLNFVSLFLVLYLLVTGVSYEVRRLIVSSNSKPESSIQASGEGIGYQPDIYYIILDKYSADRTLKDFYGYDNSYFKDFLTEKGFYVAENSFANYPRSYLSLAASLNMAYLEPPLVGGPDPLILDQELAKFLKAQGYRYLHIGSWTTITKTNPLADVNYVDTAVYFDLDEFTLRLVENTVLAPISRRFAFGPDISDYHTFHRTRALYQFDRLAEISKTQPGPKFTFAHILLPHDPYVFGPNCEPEDPTGSKIEMYLSNLSCANILVREAVDTILANSAKPPVIVFQGDEGYFAVKYPYVKGTDYLEIDPQTLQEKARILNVYYLPGVDAKEVLYPSITPVNSFRAILNSYFGTDLEILPDKSYIFENDKDNPWYYKLDGPVEFIDVTEKVK